MTATFRASKRAAQKSFLIVGALRLNGLNPLFTPLCAALDSERPCPDEHLKGEMQIAADLLGARQAKAGCGRTPMTVRLYGSLTGSQHYRMNVMNRNACRATELVGRLCRTRRQNCSVFRVSRWGWHRTESSTVPETSGIRVWLCRSELGESTCDCISYQHVDGAVGE